MNGIFHRNIFQGLSYGDIYQIIEKTQAAVSGAVSGALLGVATRVVALAVESIVNNQNRPSETSYAPPLSVAVMLGAFGGAVYRVLHTFNRVQNNAIGGAVLRPALIRHE